MEQLFTASIGLYTEKSGQSWLQIINEGFDTLIKVTKANVWIIELQGTIKSVPCHMVIDGEVIF